MGTSDVVGFILRCRRIADLSQRDLARKLGVCRSTVARWETGEREPVASMLARIARLAGLQLALVAPAASAQPRFDGDDDHWRRGAGQSGARPEHSAAPTSSDGPGEEPSTLWLAAPWPENTVRDLMGRRLPAHLDAFLSSWEESPSRGTETPERYLHVPYRPGRERLRERVPCYRPDERIRLEGPPVVRRLREPATRTDHEAWLLELRRARQVRREEQWAEYKARPGYEETPPCLCEVECHEAVLCVPQCACQCEVEGARWIL